MPFGRVAVWRDGERRLPLYICRLMIYQARFSPFSAMAPIAMAIALCCVALPATADTKPKPCRTPCLSAAVPRESAPASPPAAKPAEPRPAPVAATRPSAKPRPQAVAAVAAQPQSPPVPEVEKAAAPKRQPLSGRCSEINMRAAVGEPLSDEDMKILRSQC